jgi:membrane-associated phospholipid phosphatase
MAAHAFATSLIVRTSGITDFADPAVILPIAAATLLILIATGWRRGVVAWIAAVGGTLCLILLFKLRFFACDQLIPEARIRNPSGHTAAAAVVYGSIGITAAQSLLNVRRWLVPFTIAIALPIAIIIGASRMELDMHSMTEVVIGGCIGIAGAISFVALAGPPAHNLRVVRLLVIAVAVIALLHGARLSVEADLKGLAGDIRKLVPETSAPVC